MKQTRRVPFDLEKAKRGAKIVTRCGYPVRIGLFDAKNEYYPIIAAVERDGQEDPYRFTAEGNFHYAKKEAEFDLFIEEEEEIEEPDYNPYKETVKSISDMIERYSDANSNLQDFYDNVKVKCREAVEYDKKWCKKQEEQKTSDSLEISPNKWYTCIAFCLSKDIIDFVEGYYYLGSDILKNCLLKKDKDYIDFFRPWNINDAKPGDILASKDDVFIFKHMYKEIPDICDSYCEVIANSGLGLGFEFSTDNVYPATKEQRDLLFQKMKEAGYEWDSDKKELHKIGEKVKTRLMTHQELADWLRAAPEERREFMYKGGDYVYTSYDYLVNQTNIPVYDKLIRRNHGEWQEPLIEE